jgi:regulator of protease activity HflC (stomatin/prohibitin superfamily)
MRVERGEQLVFPGPMEVFEPKKEAFKLQKHEYIKLLDTATGIVRVEIGEQIVFPQPTELAVNMKVEKAVDVDDETSVLVVSKETGQQRLVTDKGPFFPGPHDEIVKVQKLIRVEPHEMAIVRDNAGVYTFHDGRAGGKGTSFFLQPYCELVTMYWGSGTSKEDLDRNIVRNAKMPVHKVPMTKIDLRSQYAMFEYNVRTSDNVELVLEGTIFWQVLDVQKMIHATGDPKGDVWYHCRSSLIQAISRVSLETFMTEFNEIVTNAAQTDDDFFRDRGVCVHTLEVTRYECADQQTSAVLQEIIQETTNRINRMQQQQSENDVLKEKMAGEIEIEKQKKELIQTKSDNDRLRALAEGEADGYQLAKSAATFLSVLSDALPDSDSRIALLKFVHEQRDQNQQTASLAAGNANLFLTPQDMKLKLNMPHA